MTKENVKTQALAKLGETIHHNALCVKEAFNRDVAAMKAAGAAGNSIKDMRDMMRIAYIIADKGWKYGKVNIARARKMITEGKPAFGDDIALYNRMAKRVSRVSIAAGFENPKKGGPKAKPRGASTNAPKGKDTAATDAAGNAAPKATAEANKPVTLPYVGENAVNPAIMKAPVFANRAEAMAWYAGHAELLAKVQARNAKTIPTAATNAGADYIKAIKAIKA